MNLKQIAAATYGRDIFPQDRRLKELYHACFHFELKEYTELAVWKAKAEEIKRRILVCGGLEPMPGKCPLNAKLFDKVECDGFSVEKVMFESFPGFMVTGNLYRPLRMLGKRPAILNPHGHWKNGRLERTELVDIPLRCANLAVLGFVAFSYDMVGFADSRQIEHWFGAYEEELWGIGPFELQLWNSVRSIDFLESLPDVDTAKIGCTGASGGGTQTFFLGVADERIQAVVPVNMISSSYSGGCKCENAAGLTLHTNNIEIVSLFAPKPLLITGCTGDWTKDIPQKEYPGICQIYGLFDAEDKAEYFYCDAEHNYNKKTREAMYRFFQKVFLGRDEAVVERDIQLPDTETLRIYPGVQAKGKCPEQDAVLRTLRQVKTDTSQKLLSEAVSGGGAGRLRDVLSILFGLDSAVADEPLQEELLKETETAEWSARTFYLGSETFGEKIPVTRITPRGSQPAGVVVAFGGDGGRALLSDPKAAPRLTGWLREGIELVLADAFLTGDYHKPYAQIGRPHVDALEADDGGTFLSHLTGYNLTDCQLQVGDVCRVYRHVRTQTNAPVKVAGFGKAGLWCLAALPFLDADAVYADLRAYPDTVDDYLESFYVPGFLGVGGFEACVAASAADEVSVFGDPEREAVLAAYYADRNYRARITKSESINEKVLRGF